jgi:hypothetical protein
MKLGFGRPGLRGWAPVALVVVLVPLVQRCQKPAPRPAAVDSMRNDERLPTENERRMSEASAKIDSIIKRYAPEWMKLPGVFGVAEGRTPEGRPCVLVLVQDRTKIPRIPDEIEGVPVRFDETDSIRAMSPGPPSW